MNAHETSETLSALLIFEHDDYSEICGLLAACESAAPAFDLLVLGDHPLFRTAEALVPERVRSITVLTDPGLDMHMDVMPHACAAASYFEKAAPQTVFAVSGETADRVLPMLAVMLNGSCLLDIKDIRLSDTGELRAAKSIWNMNLDAQYGFLKSPALATIRPPKKNLPGVLRPVSRQEFPVNRSFDYTDYEVAVFEPTGLDSAARLVVAGAGVGEREKFDSAKALAKKLGAAFGATRPPVQEGVVPLSCQIGSSGTICAPGKSLVFGASGAAPFAAGIENSKLIIGVNNDPGAELFSFCDYGAVADCREMIDLMLELAGAEECRND